MVPLSLSQHKKKFIMKLSKLFDTVCSTVQYSTCVVYCLSDLIISFSCVTTAYKRRVSQEEKTFCLMKVKEQNINVSK